MRGYLIGLDIGTTACKCIVFDETMTILGQSSVEYELIHLSENEIEQDAEIWWEISKEAIKRSVKCANIDNEKIKGICISSQGISFVPVDHKGDPIRNAFSWLDMRASAEVFEILSAYDKDQIFRSSGKLVNAAYTLPKMMWLRKNEPVVYNKAYKFLTAHDFIIYKLCGKTLTDHSLASGTMLYDIRKKSWDKDIITKFGLSYDKLPEIAYSGTIAGYVTEDTALELGISAKTAVVTGGQDQKCAALGAGINSSNITVSLGTATAIERISSTSENTLDENIPIFSYLFKDMWIKEGVISTSCVTLKWFRDNFLENFSYEELDKIVENNRDRFGKIYFYPFLGGANSPEWYEHSRGCLYGIDLATTKADIIMSIFEAVAFQILSNINAIEPDTDNICEIRLYGGGAVSDTWCQIISDITNKKVSTLDTSETACAGAAMLAGLAAGVFSDLENPEKFVKVRQEFMPDKKMAINYSKIYKDYIDIQNRIMY